MLLRQAAGLDRSVDRKVRILMAMRKEQERLCRDGTRTAPKESPGQPGQEVAPAGSSADADPSRHSGQALKVRATGLQTERPSDGNSDETPKSPEQSQNVKENKGPAAEEVAA